MIHFNGRQLIFQFAFAVCSLTGIVPAASADDDMLLQAVHQVLDAQTGEEIEEAYDAVFDLADDDALEELRLHENDGVALMAEWERITRTMSHVAWPDENSQVDGLRLRYKRGDLNRLLGMIEGRLRCRTPEWWESSFLSMRTMFDSRDLYTRYGRTGPRYVRHEEHGLWLNDRVDATLDGDTWQLSIDDGEIVRQFPAALLEEPLDRNDCAFTVSLRDWDDDSPVDPASPFFVLVHSSGGGDVDHAILYQISESGEIEWQRPLLCHAHFFARSGQPACLQEFQIVVDERNDRVHVFGVDLSMLQLHSFSLNDGTPVCSFNTAW